MRPASKSWADEEKCAKGLIIPCQESSQRANGNLALTSQDLPQRDVGFENAHGVAAQRVVGNFAERPGGR